MTEADSNKKIVNPERIFRILRKMATGKLPVLIRAESQPTVAVKGRICELGTTNLMNKQYRVIKLEGLSPKGAAFIVDKKKLTIEFVLASRKVCFETRLLKVTHGKYASITLPKELVSLERRKNARYKVVPECPSYISIDNWKWKKVADAMMPCFPAYYHLKNRIILADVSVGGGCVYSHYPAIKGYAKAGLIDATTRLWLPMQAPIPVKMEIRWIRETVETITNEEFEERKHEIIRIGYQLVEPEEETINIIKKYIQQLSHREAI